MSFNKEIVKKALDRIKERNERAEIRVKLRQQELYKKIPRLLEIEEELANLSISLVKLITAGGDISNRFNEIKKENLKLQSEREQLLCDNGYDKDYLKPIYYCKECEDSGYVGREKCKCLKNLICEIALEQLSQNKFELTDFDSFELKFYPEDLREDMADIKQYAIDYSDDFDLSSPNILMTGKTGLGKTHLSLAIAKKVIEKGYSVFYDSYQNIINKIEKERFSKNDDSDIMSIILDVDLLILDDVGSEWTNQFTVPILYNIVNSRLLSGKPTIISTNLESREISEKYTDRVLSRITGEYQTLPFVGEDIRILKKSME